MPQPDASAAPAPTASAIIAAVQAFVGHEVVPLAADLDHADRYPHDLVARMRELGLFGALVPREWGGLGLDVTTYARVIEELCRGWMSLAGVINSHTMAALIVLQHGTDEQRARFLPRFARGECRGGLALTEPHAGSDVQAIRTVAHREGDHYLVSGSKMFITNGREGNTLALLARTDPAADPPHKGMSCFIVEKGHPGFQVVKSIGKIGYKGVDTVELLFDQCPVPAANLVGGVEGRGFRHVMSGLETGRINIAARAVGVGQAVLDAVRAAGGRADDPRLVRMTAKVEGARLLTYWAGAMKDRGERCDLEAGMAKLHASEIAHEVATDAVRLLGVASQSLDGTLERHYRDTPLMIIGEGANEIQRTLIARQLVDRYGERAGALISREGESAERRQVVMAVRQLVDKDVAPVAQEHDGRATLSRPLVDRLADLGALAAMLPGDAGGLDLDLRTAVMLVEEVARGWGALGVLLADHLAVTRVIARHGGDREVAALLPALGRAECQGAAVATAAVSARSAPGGGLILDGHAGLDRAAAGPLVALVPVPGRGLAVLRTQDAGLWWEAGPQRLGLRGLGPITLGLAGAALPAGRLLVGDLPGAETRALVALGSAAVSLGLAQAALEAALRYSQQRTTFGKPICQHQAIQLKLADMATRTAAARLLTYRAAERLDAWAADSAGADGARIEAAETAAFVTVEAMRIHGGYGYTTEFPVERYYRDAAALLAEAAG